MLWVMPPMRRRRHSWTGSDELACVWTVVSNCWKCWSGW
jgi:hypothetical protein